ncbi:hypothetical protein GGF31_001834 [Allomyces arbusculus]|nr:hypothetical protein GGF31_001834 [Allomyces arbusculus]
MPSAVLATVVTVSSSLVQVGGGVLLMVVTTSLVDTATVLSMVVAAPASLGSGVAAAELSVIVLRSLVLSGAGVAASELGESTVLAGIAIASLLPDDKSDAMIASLLLADNSGVVTVSLLLVDTWAVTVASELLVDKSEVVSALPLLVARPVAAVLAAGAFSVVLALDPAAEVFVVSELLNDVPAVLVAVSVSLNVVPLGMDAASPLDAADALVTVAMLLLLDDARVVLACASVLPEEDSAVFSGVLLAVASLLLVDNVDAVAVSLLVGIAAAAVSSLVLVVESATGSVLLLDGKSVVPVGVATVKSAVVFAVKTAAVSVLPDSKTVVLVAVSAPIETGLVTVVAVSSLVAVVVLAVASVMLLDGASIVLEVVPLLLEDDSVALSGVLVAASALLLVDSVTPSGVLVAASLLLSDSVIPTVVSRLVTSLLVDGVSRANQESKKRVSIISARRVIWVIDTNSSEVVSVVAAVSCDEVEVCCSLVGVVNTSKAVSSVEVMDALVMNGSVDVNEAESCMEKVEPVVDDVLPCVGRVESAGDESWVEDEVWRHSMHASQPVPVGAGVLADKLVSAALLVEETLTVVLVAVSRAKDRPVIALVGRLVPAPVVVLVAASELEDESIAVLLVLGDAGVAAPLLLLDSAVLLLADPVGLSNRIAVESVLLNAMETVVPVAAVLVLLVGSVTVSGDVVPLLLVKSVVTVVLKLVASLVAESVLELVAEAVAESVRLRKVKDSELIDPEALAVAEDLMELVCKVKLGVAAVFDIVWVDAAVKSVGSAVEALIIDVLAMIDDEALLATVELLVGPVDVELLLIAAVELLVVAVKLLVAVGMLAVGVLAVVDVLLLEGAMACVFVGVAVADEVWWLVGNVGVDPATVGVGVDVGVIEMVRAVVVGNGVVEAGKAAMTMVIHSGKGSGRDQ